MFRNRISELSQVDPRKIQFVEDPSSIGIKLRQSLSTQADSPDSLSPTHTKALLHAKQLRSAALQLQSKRRELIRATRPEKQKEIQKRIGEQTILAETAMKQMKPLVEAVNAQYKKESEAGDNSGLVDCQRVTNEASEAVAAFRQAEEKLAEEMRAGIQRQAGIVNGGQKVTDAQLDQLMKQPEMGQQMLRQKLLEVPSAQLQNAVSDIVDKCNDVLRLQRSMRECMTMMQELALLVQLQGEKLTTIQQVINSAKDHVDKGDVKLEKGKELHKKSQKKMCCIVMILLAIIGVIVIPIIVTKV